MMSPFCLVLTLLLYMYVSFYDIMGVFLQLPCYSVSCVYVSGFIPIPKRLNDCSFEICFQIQKCESSIVFLFTVVGYLGSSKILYEFQGSFFPISAKEKCHSDFNRTALYLWTAWGSMDILTILSLPIAQHRMSFHLFVSYLIFFSNVLQFIAYKSFICLSLLLFCSF